MDSWVMNVVPVSGPNTLPVIYDRGLIGVMHDWYLLIFSYHLSVHFLFSILPANSLKLLLCMCTHACIYVYIRMYLFQKFLAPGPLLYWDTEWLYGCMFHLWLQAVSWACPCNMTSSFLGIMEFILLGGAWSIGQNRMFRDFVQVQTTLMQDRMEIRVCTGNFGIIECYYKTRLQSNI